MQFKGYMLPGMTLYRFPVVGSVTDVCFKLIAMRSARHAPTPELAGVCAVHGTPMHHWVPSSTPVQTAFQANEVPPPFILPYTFSLHSELAGLN